MLVRAIISANDMTPQDPQYSFRLTLGCSTCHIEYFQQTRILLKINVVTVSWLS